MIPTYAPGRLELREPHHAVDREPDRDVPAATPLALPQVLRATNVIALQRSAGNAAVTAMLGLPQRVVMRKAAGGGSCDSGSEGGLVEEEEDEGVATDKPVQRFALEGFPPTEEALMRTAVADAQNKVVTSKPKSWRLAEAIDRKTYEYHREPEFTSCGRTWPSRQRVWIGRDAFDSSQCCDLASTIAHEVSHTLWYTERRARKLECEFFGCSC